MSFLLAHAWWFYAIRSIAVRNDQKQNHGLNVEEFFFYNFCVCCGFLYGLFPLCVLIFIAFSEKEICFLGCMLISFLPTFVLTNIIIQVQLPSSVAITSLDPCLLLVLCSVQCFGFFFAIRGQQTKIAFSPISFNERATLFLQLEFLSNVLEL